MLFQEGGVGAVDTICTFIIWIREIILLALGMCGIFVDVSE